MNRLLNIFAICLCQLVLFAQAGRAADTYTSSYLVSGGESHTAGETVNITGPTLSEDGTIDGTVATLTFGVAGGADFSSANWNYEVDGFEAYLGGNGENGSADGGTVYIIRPNYNGYITVAVVLNANKNFYITQDDTALEGFNGITVDSQYRGIYLFPVKAGSTYKVYATGSKLGFYGLKYIYTTDPEATFSAHKLTIRSNPKNGVSLSNRGTSMQVTGNTIWMDTWNWNDYRFKHWTANGEVVSTDQYFEYIMPDNDVDMVAVYEFNPSNPGDPASAENSYKLTLESKPANAGWFDQNKVTKVQAGTKTWLYVYNNQSGYVFREWQVEGKRVSIQRNFEFEMPSKDITLTAVFEFKPTSPGNPGTNLFEDGELILDDFTPGDAYDAAYTATKGEWDKVQTITLIGEVGDYDGPNLARNCNNNTVLDMSRTTGMNYVNSWAFENCSKLATISLPSTITNIGYYAFYGCSSLTTLNVYAVNPPVLDSYAFGSEEINIASQVTVFVPASSLALYQAADVWKNMNIFPLASEVCDLEISLPDGTNTALYKDMYLEAYNTKSGQRLRYVITDRLTYTFSSIIRNTTWDVTLKNAKDEVLGEIKGIDVGDKGAKMTFESLKTPKTVTISVVASETDVTDEVTITWTDEKGNFLTQGATVKNLLEGNKVNYSIALPEALAMQYQLPKVVEYTVAEGENTVSVTLTALPQVTITGSVTDKNKGSVPLQGAFIAITQTLNGQYSKTFAAKTAANGTWSLTVFDAPTEITASKTGYISETRNYEALTNVTAIDPFDLRDINGTTINLTLTYKAIDGSQTEYDDVANVAYTVVNSTTGEELTGWSLQYPKIVMQDKLDFGTTLTITATSKNQKFDALTVNVVVNNQDQANAAFVITQRGGIKASYSQSDNTACVGILYDAQGLLVKRYEYDGNNLVINELPDGSYTLVTMANSQFFNSVGQLSQFVESGLREGVDYVKKTVTVKSGAYSIISFTIVPFLDETKLYYTGSNTSFTANKSQVTAGQYLTLRGQVDFKDAYANQVSNVNLIVDLTDNCEFVANSVMLGKNLTSYTLNGKQLIVPIGTSTEQVRFCVIPTKEGMFEPSASAHFTISGKEVLQPIGSAQTVVKGVTISVPVTIAKPQFTASGTATAKSDVYVYVDDMLTAKTAVKANGKWSVECTLTDAVDKSTHPVYARIVTPQNAELLTDTKTVTYDESAILAEKVGMSFYNGWMRATQSVSWNMIEKKATPNSYSFYTTTDFTFTIDFTNNEKVTDVQLVVYKNNNTYDILNATYNTTKKIWVVTHRYSSYALPTCVKVKYVVNDKQQTVTEDADDEGNEHVNPILDPSGYVYEAVSSNRLQGVTASIYYKEITEDEYGDKHEEEMLWDAEEYAQKNPLFTDENGMYSWDVPNGTWQVRLEKEGYLETRSEWLPVPPPQLDVNLAMIQMKQPKVQSIKATNDGVEIEFDKYMNPATLTTDNIKVQRVKDTGNEEVSGSIVLLNEEPTYEGQTQTYASKLLFKVAEDDELSSEVIVTINKAVESYAGVSMESNDEQNHSIEAVVKSIKADETINMATGKQRTLTIGALPADAGKSKQMVIISQSGLIATVSEDNVSEGQKELTVTLDENGQTNIVINGELPGSTALTFRMADRDVEAQTLLNVKDEAELKVMDPRASRVDGSQVYRGAKVELTSDTEGAAIYYTLDGTDPTNESLKYSSPITIADDNVTIKAKAVGGQGLEDSEVKTFNYTLKKTNVGYAMTDGWTWISHNIEEAVPVTELEKDNVEAILGQRSEVIRDPIYGFFGGLTQLEPGQGYKVKVKANTDMTLKGYEFNAAENTVSVRRGWNWIGYPLSQTMTVAEALEFANPAEGDYILGQDGYAEYTADGWQGTLQGLVRGKGYLYKSANDAELTFNTLIVSNAPNLVAKRNVLIGSPWAYDSHAYQSVMPVTAELNGVIDNNDMIVGAFVGTECRGVGQWNKDRLSIAVYGENGEKVHFVAYNKNTKETFDINETFVFKSDNIGSWNAPTSLTIGGDATGVKALNSELAVTPLVANDHITVSAGGRQINRLTLTNMGGQTVLSVSDLGTNAVVALGALQDGLYIVTVQAEGNTYYQKIRKANN